MGVLNVTPDSFSDGGRFFDPVRAVQQGIKMAREGADIIDVGGESTRPGSEPVSAAEEIQRAIPVIQALSREVEVPISIDTCKAEVAEAGIDAGGSMINDVTALRGDPEMTRVVAERGVALVLMHMKGTPREMQKDPRYDDLLGEIHSFFSERIRWAESRGVAPEKIVLDPGIGFGKTVQHNLLLIKHLERFRSLGKPILVGTSRKSFIGRVLGAEVDQREEGTAATVALSIWNGARIVRVHDVARMVPVARMTDAVWRGGQ
jgi:dihydropteroate synthase